ncbi:histone deacetylase [Glacieibacterium sp.]|uniref:histone deacetylase family protein n=1 Tax=Glacieibacterium sp. TaxID=2860237 RepID=UPI003AFF901A
MTFALVHHADYVAPLPAGHSFPMDKYGLLMVALAESGVEFDQHVPVAAPIAWLKAVHDPAYVGAVLDGSLDPAIERRIGIPVTERVVRRSRLVCGGTWLAARLALAEGFAVNSAGGSHHALPESGAGYCVFNDLGVAGARLLAEGSVERLLVVDLDVHQGDGTAAIFAGEPRAATFSMHAAKNFPVRKQVSTRDVELPDGMGDEAYLTSLADELPSLLDSHRPQLVLYQAGVDPHAEDRLGRLGLSDDGLQRRDAYVVATCAERGIPVAATLGGGYAADRRIVADRHARGIVAMASAARGFKVP